MVVDSLITPIVSHRVVAARVHDATNSLIPRRVENIVGTDDVRSQDVVKGVVGANHARQVDDAVNVTGRSMHKFRVGNITAQEGLVFDRIIDPHDVGQDHVGVSL